MVVLFFFFFKQKTAYEMRISDWSSDVCSSDLAKAGGVPWKLADVEPDTAYIGLSYAVRPVETDKPRFVTCCSQVFDADGAGLEFIAYDADASEMQEIGRAHV